jgi:hypothetical protein
MNDHLTFNSAPTGVLEKMLDVFSPTLALDPNALAAIHQFVFAPVSTTSTTANDLLQELQEMNPQLVDPDLVEMFVHCLQGTREFVNLHALPDTDALNTAMEQQQQQVAQKISPLFRNE